jgi:hypothetical protein
LIAAARAQLLHNLLRLYREQLPLLWVTLQGVLQPRTHLPLLRLPLPPPLLLRKRCRLLLLLLIPLGTCPLLLQLLLSDILQQHLQVKVLGHSLAGAVSAVAHAQQCGHQHSTQLRHLHVLLREAAEALQYAGAAAPRQHGLIAGVLHAEVPDQEQHLVEQLRNGMVQHGSYTWRPPCLSLGWAAASTAATTAAGPAAAARLPCAACANSRRRLPLCLLICAARLHGRCAGWLWDCGG